MFFRSGRAMALAGASGEEAGVLVIGSVFLAGEARGILADDGPGSGGGPLIVTVPTGP